MTNVQAVPAQHAPHGVSEQLPPLDQTPPSPPQLPCVVLRQLVPKQQVPHGCEMHAVPAPPQLPPPPVHAACVTLVQFPLMQHEPVDCAHGLGEQPVPRPCQVPEQLPCNVCVQFPLMQHAPRQVEGVHEPP